MTDSYATLRQATGDDRDPMLAIACDFIDLEATQNRSLAKRFAAYVQHRAQEDAATVTEAVTSSQAERIALLREHGFIVGPRDPLRNTAFLGRFMVAQPINAAQLPTEAASDTAWCVVGDNLTELVDHTINAFNLEP
jgi:hypothetical protein